MISTVLSMLASLAGLISKVLDWWKAKQQFDAGKGEVLQETAKEVAEVVGKAKVAKDEAEKEHSGEESDAAFDTEFRRD